MEYPVITTFSQLTVTPMPDGHRWIVTEPFLYSTSLHKIEVPKGFITDFASIPRVFWRILPPTGKYTMAAVIHDWLYFSAYMDNRKLCDNIFSMAMDSCGVPIWKREVLYRGVRLFGWAGWGAHKERTGGMV